MLFVIVGVVAGLAFGVYLLDMKNTNQLVFVDGPSISIVIEKTDFKKGEEITFKIVNSGTVQLRYHNHTLGLKITDLAGIEIVAWVNTPAEELQLEPRAELVRVWSQNKSDGEPVLEGLYKIHVMAYDEQQNWVKDTATITIWK